MFCWKINLHTLAENKETEMLAHSLEQVHTLNINSLTLKAQKFNKQPGHLNKYGN